jgi:predicted dehydrogenase
VADSESVNRLQDTNRQAHELRLPVNKGMKMTTEKFDRRLFLTKSAQSLLLASGAIYASAASAKTATEEFALDKLKADTERQDEEYVEPLPSSDKIGIAVVGLGDLAIKEILPAFAKSKKCKIAALVTGHRDKGLQLAKQYNLKESDVYSYADYENIATNPAASAVYIVLPNSMHKEFTLRAAKAGKHVLCEKPMATSVEDCQAMIKACADNNRKLMIAYRIQYEPNNRMIQEFVRSKKFGKAKVIQATNVQNQGDPNHWRLKKALAGGGALFDIGIYCLNTTRFLLGEEPNEVYASTFSTPNDLRFNEVEETIAFQLKFPSGTIAVCDASYGAHECRQYRVMAERGWYGLDPAYSYNGLKPMYSQAEGKVELLTYPNIAEKNQFATEMDHFADSIINDRKPYTPGEEGLQDQIIMQALYQSSEQRKPVTLPTETRLDITRGAFK